MPQTRETKSHSKPTPLKRPMLTLEGAAGPAQRYRGWPVELSLYKILFHFKALLYESIILLQPHLQILRYCNTIARPLRNIRPPTDPSFACHTPYNIGHGNIV